MSKITNMRKVKQDDKFTITMREIQSQNPANKKCFDCEQRGPTYINMTIGSFVCTKCSGMLRGINPPHRIKSISMSSFTSEEVEMMRSRGNAWCAAVWLGNYNRNTQPIDFKDDEKIKEFIVAKYEKKRYYVDPAQANLSSIKQQLTGGSTGSADSHGSHKLHSSALIGSTLKARVDPSSVISRPASSHVVSRPEHAAPAPTNGAAPHVPHVAPQVPHVAPVSSNPVAAAVSSAGDNFANFADFDTAAFDSLPPDPLTQPPPSSATLPPLPRKPSTGTSDPPPAAAPPSAGVTKAAGDKYSALAELDDLFRTTALDSPAAPAAAPEPGPVFSPAPAPGIPNMFVSEPERGAASPSWFGRSSPAAGGGWGGAGGKTSPMWTPVWDTSAKPAPAPGPGLAPAQQNTNPFGSSPSNPPLGFGQMFSDNNNDLFAAAPKPFITEKPGVNNSGNPWSVGGVGGAASFTSTMTPAHNPNNPFL